LRFTQRHQLDGRLAARLLAPRSSIGPAEILGIWLPLPDSLGHELMTLRGDCSLGEACFYVKARRYLRGLAEADHRARCGGDPLDLAPGLGLIGDGGKLMLDDRCRLAGWLLVDGRL
jgi:hypothetical protein